jgi:hypothetical protein
VEIILDQVTAERLKGDREKFKLLSELQSIYRGSLARQRRLVADRLVEILASHARPKDFNSWQRLVDFQYAGHPLSAHGSVTSESGGRFNVGDVDQFNLRPFPALYLGSSRKVAFFEKYGVQENGTQGRLAAHEAALADYGSIACVRVKGHLESWVDVEDRKCLKKLTAVFRTFTIPKEAHALARKLGIVKPLTVICTPEQLLKTLREENWRQWTMHFDLLSNSQHLGQIAWNAGIEALEYTSTKAAGRCLAIYPENFKDSLAFVEIEDASPPSLRHKRLDGNSWKEFL